MAHGRPCHSATRASASACWSLTTTSGLNAATAFSISGSLNQANGTTKPSHSALIAVKPVYGWPRNRRSRVADLRTVQFSDLLRRDKRRVLDPSVATMLTGARVLVTGAGGSIGQELCRQIRGHDPACLYKLDYDESNMHTLQLELYGQALLDSSGVIIADVRDEARIQQVLSFTRPDVVFHIAAHNTCRCWSVVPARP